MPTLPLRPSLQQLRKQATDLRRTGSMSRAEALLAVARGYGFDSWARLKHHVELVNGYTRVPDSVAPSDDPAREFLRLGCLTYSAADDPARWRSARHLLAEHPSIPESGIHAAAAVADPVAVQRFLATDRALARAEGGPYRWEPLCYLAYARHDPAVPRERVLDTATVLLRHGADPNAGYLWHGLPSPFTVLTGAFGEGELGPERQPRHPHAGALAELLLESGADPNDAQTLYNRMFGADDDHLVLLLRYGLGTGDGGPWRARLGDALDPPPVLLRGQLRWAVSHGMVARVRLLAAHGVDLATPFDDGRTPAGLAAWTGHASVAETLVAQGAPAPDLDPVDAFVAAALAGDRSAVEPGIVQAARAARPGLVVWAAGLGRTGAVELLVSLGFDVNALGRADVPVEEPWQTALHTAVSGGDLAMVRLLLRLGADREIRDARFDATPAGWARHFGREDLARLLELT